MMWGTSKSCRVLILFALGVWAVTWLAGCQGAADTPPIEEGRMGSVESRGLSPEVKNILKGKTELVATLASDYRIVSAVVEANRESRGLSDEEILERDARWQATTGIDEFIKPFLTNDCADVLVEFQEAHDGFPELLVTDSRGLLVAASNKSTDYLQADEGWWTKTYDEGCGHTGPLEYDKSARSESISVCVPIYDPHGHRVIGVIKAVCDVTAIKLEL